MLFGYFTLFVALTISAVAAYYSIVGLTAIFSAAVIPIIIMGASLEIGKVTAAVWLKMNWARASRPYKIYLVPAVAFLMVLTSMGIFGFLSKAHTDQGLVSGDVQAKISIYDEKLTVAKNNIESNRKALKQLDDVVDQILLRSSDEKGTDKVLMVRRSQAKERARLMQEIEAEQKKVIQLNDERAPIAAEVRKVNAEVGPIKYVAALVYGDNPDENLLERAVRWVIILIVIVFDPLALVLILAAQQSLRWAAEDREKELSTENKDQGNKEVAVMPGPEDVIPVAVEEPLQDEQGVVSATPSPEVGSTPPAPPAGDLVEEKIEEPQINNETTTTENAVAEEPQIQPETTVVENVVIEEPQVQPETTVVENTVVEEVNQSSETIEAAPPIKIKPPAPPEAQERKAKEVIVVPETFNPRKETTSDLTADNENANNPEAVKAHFGIGFPDAPEKGDLFLRVDYLPSRLFKYNGSAWIEVDKTLTDSYVYDHEYIKYLVGEIETGHLDLDDLSTSEQEQIAEFLSNNEQTRNAT